MLTETRRRLSNGCRRSKKACRRMRHGQVAHFRIGVVGQQLALDHVRIFEDLRYVVHRSDGDLSRLEKRNIFGLSPLNDEGAKLGIKLRGMSYAIRVRAETRIFQEVGPPDG